MFNLNSRWHSAKEHSAIRVHSFSFSTPKSRKLWRQRFSITPLRVNVTWHELIWQQNLIWTGVRLFIVFYPLSMNNHILHYRCMNIWLWNADLNPARGLHHIYVPYCLSKPPQNTSGPTGPPIRGCGPVPYILHIYVYTHICII